MKLLWLCNMVPARVEKAITGNEATGGLWVDQVLDGLLEAGVQMRVLCPGSGAQGEAGEGLQYRTFREGLPYKYLPELEDLFSQELQAFAPEVIHIWGVEYGHTLAMMNACEKAGLLEHTTLSIQGLCSVIAGHYLEGIPQSVAHGWTFRDLLRWDNLSQQRKKFLLRGNLEKKALEKARHVIGRTDWDRACVYKINPTAQYHFCNETLRRDFYDGQWQYEACRKHRIFASSCAYPVKGFHYLLEAFAQILKTYPDATLAVTGKDPRTVPFYRLGSYQRYLIRLMKQYGLEGKVEFLGGLSAGQMKEQYLHSNVFVLPSTIENSPNSLGEAMLLGVPCVASDVGGVANLMNHREDGFVYQSTAPYMLAHYIGTVFEKEETAGLMGKAASAHGSVTHDPQGNLQALTAIYRSLSGGV